MLNRAVLQLACLWAVLAPALIAESGAAAKAKSKVSESSGRLELARKLVVKSELAQSFVDPVKCDSDGNVYLMTQIEATSGIRKISPKGQHTFRHSYRALLDSTGAPVGVQQKLMRHAQVGTTMNWYGNALMGSKREANGKVVKMVLAGA